MSIVLLNIHHHHTTASRICQQKIQRSAKKILTKKHIFYKIGIEIRKKIV